MVNLEAPHQPVFYYVPKRDALTLQKIIKFHIPPGSTIVSDEWRAYHGLTNHQYLHLTVNHSRNFVDPNTGETTDRYFKCSCLYYILT